MTSEELLGKLALDHANLTEEYRRLLQLLRQVVTGDTPREAVSIDMDRLSWSIAPSPVTEVATQEETPCPPSN